jgi:hypothetical protein
MTLKKKKQYFLHLFRSRRVKGLIVNIQFTVSSFDLESLKSSPSLKMRISPPARSRLIQKFETFWAKSWIKVGFEHSMSKTRLTRLELNKEF